MIAFSKPKNPGKDLVTHNHVAGFPPSGDDVALMMQFDHAEIQNTGYCSDMARTSR